MCGPAVKEDTSGRMQIGRLFLPNKADLHCLFNCFHYVKTIEGK